MKSKVTLKFLALLCALNFLSCGSDKPAPTPEPTPMPELSPELSLVEESAEFIKALFKATTPEDQLKTLFPEVDKVKDENKAKWAAEYETKCTPVEKLSLKAGNLYRLEAVAKGVNANPKLEDLRNYTINSCSKISETISDRCLIPLQTALELLYKSAQAVLK